jgi:hypothetical protein
MDAAGQNSLMMHAARLSNAGLIRASVAKGDWSCASILTNTGRARTIYKGSEAIRENGRPSLVKHPFRCDKPKWSG